MVVAVAAVVDVMTGAGMEVVVAVVAAAMVTTGVAGECCLARPSGAAGPALGVQ
jgi:hypothetical protein